MACKKQRGNGVGTGTKGYRAGGYGVDLSPCHSLYPRLPLCQISFLSWPPLLS